MSTVLVVEPGVIEALGAPPAGVVVLPRSLASPWRRRRNRWAVMNREHVLDALERIPRPALILARPARADAGAACVRALARVAGIPVVDLPACPARAAWSLGTLFRFRVFDDVAASRVVDVMCCGPSVWAALPQRPWGAASVSVPALRPATIVRWAECAWRPCSWCRGGGLPGHGCPRCRTPIPHDHLRDAA